MCTVSVRLPLAELLLGEQPGIPHSFCYLRVTVSKSPLLQETTTTTTVTSELAAYTLEMASLDDRDLDILTSELFSTPLNLSPIRVSHRHYFTEAQSQNALWALRRP